MAGHEGIQNNDRIAGCQHTPNPIAGELDSNRLGCSSLLIRRLICLVHY